ncbi:MAG: hypothetical protein KBA46_08265, partial [Candidatus Omnitrophica bacterium]|nr:hypothetical protein [Candidatus Omnitrophota bacterium]
TGISYHLTSAVAVGIESKGSYSDPTAALGPTLSWSGKTVWAAAGTAWGLGRGSDDMQARLIVGVLL